MSSAQAASAFIVVSAVGLTGGQAVAAQRRLPEPAPATVPAAMTPEQLGAIYPGASSLFTPENVVEGLRELEASPLERHEATLGSLDAFTYVVDGAELTLPSAAAVAGAGDTSGSPSPTAKRPQGGGGSSVDLSYRYSSGRYAFGFNVVEQQMLA